MRLSAFALCSAVFTVILLAGHPAWSVPIDRYKEIDLSLLTSYLVNGGIIPLENDNAFDDYLQISECDLYMTNGGDPFKRQEMKQMLASRIKVSSAESAPELYIKIQTPIYVTGYNFNTQALVIAPQSVMMKVNIIEVADATSFICQKTSPSKLTYLPSSYSARLNFPVSLFRIPFKKSIAESILPKLDKVYEKNSFSIIYASLYIQIEPVRPEILNQGNRKRGILRGQVNFIDLYADHDRKLLLKRLNYADNY